MTDHDDDQNEMDLPTVHIAPEPYRGKPPFVRNSQTSRAAAMSKIPTARGDRARIARFLHECGDHGANCWEVEQALDMLHQTASAALRGMELRGLVVKMGKRPTGTGRKGYVYVLSSLAVPRDAR